MPPRPASGKARCSASRTPSSASRSLARARAAARAAGAGRVLRVQRRARQPLRALAAARVEAAAAGSVPQRGDDAHRRQQGGSDPDTNSVVDVDGRKLPSVSGGTRWGGGVWMNSRDAARFGLLFLRRGKWGSRQSFRRRGFTMPRRPARGRTTTASCGGSTLRRSVAVDARLDICRDRLWRQHDLDRPRARPRRRLALAPGQRRGVLRARRGRAPLATRATKDVGSETR